MSIITVTKENYASVTTENSLVLLDFWAVWCGPCKMIAPILAEIAEEREDVVVGKVDVDSEMELAMQFGVSSIPTLVVIRNGQPVNKAVGYMPKEKVLALLDA
ncbi:MAG: thioredoxin [Oscillospiraceae bacterium]|nr:thioredoxin [Oscillospiraceae bacterium]